MSDLLSGLQSKKKAIEKDEEDKQNKKEVIKDQITSDKGFKFKVEDNVGREDLSVKANTKGTEKKFIVRKEKTNNDSDSDEYELDDGDEGAALNPTKLKELMSKKKPEEIFKEFDEDESGTLSISEFIKMLPSLGIRISEAKATKYFKQCDTDGSGEIDFDEFKVALFTCDPDTGNSVGFNPNKLLTPLDAFEMFDEDGSGELGEDEFADVLEYLGLKVPDEIQEKLFNQYDKDKSGAIDFDEFKFAWLRLANVEGELLARGIKVSKWSSKYLNMRKLEKILDDEEDKEKFALAQSKRAAAWQAELKIKKHYIAQAKRRSEEELVSALDAAGQVYVFGVGNQFQYSGLAMDNIYENFRVVKDAWEYRVSAYGTNDVTQLILAQDPVYPGEKPTNVDEIATRVAEMKEWDIEEKEEEEDEAEARSITVKKDDLNKNAGVVVKKKAKSFFKHLVVMPNTCVLWGREVIQVGLGDHAGFALSADGRLYGWGGKNDFWESTLDAEDSIKEEEDLNERSKLLLTTSVKTKNIISKEMTTKEKKQLANETEATKLRTVLKYYHKWKPPPSNNTAILYYRTILIPLIHFSDVVNSLKYRGKEIENKNKLQLLDILYEDLVFEEANGLESAELRKMEINIQRCWMEKKLHEQAINLENEFADKWKDVLIKQIQQKEAMEMMKEKALVDMAKKKEEKFRGRLAKDDAAMRDKLPQLTDRGHGREIPINGITHRGAVPETHRGSQIMANISSGAFHAGAVHSNGQLFMWGDGSYGRLGQALRIGETLPSCEKRWRTDRLGEVTERALTTTRILANEEKKNDNDDKKNEDDNDKKTDLDTERTNDSNATSVVSRSSSNSSSPTKRTSRKQKQQTEQYYRMLDEEKKKEKEDNKGEEKVIIEEGKKHNFNIEDRKQYGAGFVNGLDKSKYRVQERIEMRRDRPKPTRVMGFDQPVVNIACGFSHNICVTLGGRVYVWGSGNNGRLGLGQIGNGFESFVPSPTRLHIPGGRRLMAVSCGNAHSAAVTDSGELLIWGCGDNGRLGLGADEMGEIHTPMPVNDKISLFKGKRLKKVSCGASHTIVLTSCDTVWIENELFKTSKIVGGEVYQCGGAIAIGKFTPLFEKVKGLNHCMVDIAAGSTHSACVSIEGELFTWGFNGKGCCGHPTPDRIIKQPQLVKALYQAPTNIALDKVVAQSSIFNNLGPTIAIDGDTEGIAFGSYIHTQSDPQAWWEVDVGDLSRIECIKVWNRDDEPLDESKSRHEYRARLFPFWLLVSQVPFNSDVGATALDKAVQQSVAKKKFTKVAKEIKWDLPPNTIGQYVRIVLEKANFLHIAQLQVFGVIGVEKSVGRVSSVVCGNEVTAAIINPVESELDIENAYKSAVKADANNSNILRNYKIYRKSYEKHGDGRDIHDCPLCIGGKFCEICLVNMKWSHVTKEMPKGPLGRRRRLNSISDALVNEDMPPLDYKHREKKKEKNLLNSIFNTIDKIQDTFKTKSILSDKYKDIMENYRKMPKQLGGNSLMQFAASMSSLRDDKEEEKKEEKEKDSDSDSDSEEDKQEKKQEKRKRGGR